MSDAEAKQIERMKSVLEAQKAAFRAERHRPIDKRRADLERVAELCRKNADAIAEAISRDFGNRARQESVIAEIAFVIQDAGHTSKMLGKWMKTRRVGVPMTLMPGKAEIRREPKGVAGIVSPWNYPFQLAMAPLVAALGAGCRAMVKPSEYTPATSELMKSLLAEVFEEDHVAVITGGPAVGEAFTRLSFDHLFYTGSTQVGRLVAKAAAENLVPVTLELGGKSPPSSRRIIRRTRQRNPSPGASCSMPARPVSHPTTSSRRTARSAISARRSSTLPPTSSPMPRPTMPIRRSSRTGTMNGSMP